jgi:hypothetical protein
LRSSFLKVVVLDTPAVASNTSIQGNPTQKEIGSWNVLAVPLRAALAQQAPTQVPGTTLEWLVLLAEVVAEVAFATLKAWTSFDSKHHTWLPHACLNVCHVSGLEVHLFAL